ncbi:MAG TPA: hypothetical protein VFB03_03010 [Candidatus Saccharimonadales bacterium]|nr:hypothetical protein [Candidatus Saccharimonadales bacterium]
MSRITLLRIFQVLTGIFFIAGGIYILIRSLSTSTQPSHQAQQPSYSVGPAGTWSTGDTSSTISKGRIVDVLWSDIESTPGHFDFTKLDAQLDSTTAKGQYAMAQVETGEGVPAWLSDPHNQNYITPGCDNLSSVCAGVQMDDGSGGLRNYPLYLDPKNHTLNQVYLDRFHSMVDAFLAHIKKYNDSHGHKIVGLGCPIGNSTDPHPYDPHDTYYFDKSHNGWGKYGQPSFISDSDWQLFEIGDKNRGIEGQLTYYVEAAKTKSPDTPCLINANHNRTTADFALNTLPDAWLKLSRIGDRYDNNNELNDDAYYVSTKTREKFADGHIVRTRSEMDLTYCHTRRGDPTCRDGWFTAAPVWQMYWSQLWALDRGLDMHDQKPFDLENLDFGKAYGLFNQYAGYKSPQDSPGVWIAFRDNLDTADTTRFPACDPVRPPACYGAYKNGTNGDRYRAIESQFLQYGVQKPDDSRNSSYADYHRPELGDTDWWGLEDVTNNTYKGNYSMWLSMKDPDGTSQGLWRVGCSGVSLGSCKEPYGRYARRFDHTSGKNNFYLDIDNRFFGDQGTHSADIKVTYYDLGSGSFSVKYDDVEHKGKFAGDPVKLQNSKTWKEADFTVNDGAFNNGLEKGSDIILQNEDPSQDVIFHMVEVQRGSNNSAQSSKTAMPGASQALNNNQKKALSLNIGSSSGTGNSHTKNHAVIKVATSIFGTAVVLLGIGFLLHAGGVNLLPKKFKKEPYNNSVTMSL